jgi:hypothetical protein
VSSDHVADPCAGIGFGGNCLTNVPPTIIATAKDIAGGAKVEAILMQRCADPYAQRWAYLTERCPSPG